MHLRKLQIKDAPLMLEWMHDPDCVANLQANFSSKTLQDCEAFICVAQEDKHNLHLAIADADDTYMGTVSLKHIDETEKHAEFAISMRKCAMGKGFAQYGMRSIINLGIDELGLNHVYWCVRESNKRAVRFYDKNGYRRVTASAICALGYTLDQMENYIWYAEYK